jgi:hypothetical protein
MVMRRMILTGVVLLLTVALAGADLPNFSGSWKINMKESDGPEMGRGRDRGTGMGGQRGGMGGGRGGMGGGGRGGSGGGGRHSGERGGERELLVIDQQEEMITIRRGGERERVLYTDGRVSKTETVSGALIERTARWQETSLVVVEKGSRRPTTMETWSLSADGRKLTVIRTVQRDGEERTLRTVYDRRK